jgi:hypothetical protein
LGAGSVFNNKRVADIILENLSNFRNVECFQHDSFLSVNKHFKSSFSVLHLNIRSYRKNFDDLLINLESCKVKYDLIVLTETWLQENECALTVLDGFTVYSNKNRRNQNDGVICYVNNNLHVSLCEITLHGATALSLNLTVGERVITVLAVYRSPSHDGDLGLFIDDLERYCDNRPRDRTHLIVGDINICILDDSRTVMVERYLNVLYGAGFVSCIDKPTRVSGSSSSLIDHIFVDLKSSSDVKGSVIKASVTDHYITTFEWNISNLRVILPCAPKILIDKTKVKTYIEQNNWVPVMQCLDANECAELLSNNLKIILQNSSTISKTSHKLRKLKPWISQGLIISIRRRDHLNKRVKSQPFNTALCNQYTTYRNILSSSIKAAKENYYKTQFQENAGNPKKLWKNISELVSTNKKSEPIQISQFFNKKDCTPSDRNYCSSKEVADKFNDYYVGVGAELASKVPVAGCVIDDEQYRTQMQFHLVPVTERQLEDCVRELRGGSAPGVDGITADIIKENFYYLKHPLLHLVNLSLQQGTFPDSFKLAKVIPIYKGGEKGECSSYRPISLLNVLSKILEKCVGKQLADYLFRNNLIYDKQFGFRSDLTADDAFFTFSNHLHHLTNSNQRSLMIFIDLAKAFDSLERNILLRKLDCLGIRGVALNWFASYLSNRRQLVSLEGVQSEVKKIEYGVIQGSTLGPLLFLIYQNNLGKVDLTNGSLYLYADDTVLVFKGCSWDEVYCHAARGLLTVKRWFDQNKLTVNVSKTKCMAVSLRAAGDPVHHELRLHSCGGAAQCRGCTVIERVDRYKYLGVTFDSRLSWEPHIKSVNNKLRKCIYMFSVLSRVLEIDLIKSVYFAYVQSILQYGIVCWGGALPSMIYPLQVTQKGIIKSALQKPVQYPTQLVFESFQVLDIRQLFIKTLILYGFKRNFTMLEQAAHTYGTRHRANVGIVTPRIVKSTYASNPYYVIHLLYGNLPPELRRDRPMSLVSYKKNLFRWLFNLGRETACRMLSSIYTLSA